MGKMNKGNFVIEKSKMKRQICHRDETLLIVNISHHCLNPLCPHPFMSSSIHVLIRLCPQSSSIHVFIHTCSCWIVSSSIHVLIFRCSHPFMSSSMLSNVFCLLSCLNCAWINTVQESFLYFCIFAFVLYHNMVRQAVGHI